MSDFLHKWAELSPGKLDLAKVMLRKEGVSFQAIPIVPVKKESKCFPLSFGQQRLWFLNQLLPGNPLYNTPFTLKVNGKMDKAVLEKSLNEIVRRHEILRTVFVEIDKEPFQEVLPELKIQVAFRDLRTLSEENRENKIQKYIRKEAKHPFDLSTAPLIRSMLLQVKDDEFIFLLTMHHIVSDGWSIGVFMNELRGLYHAFSNGKPSPFSELPVQYSDYSVWQHTWMDEEALKSQIEYWKEQLKGIPDLIDLPTDRPRPLMQSAEGSTYTFYINKELTQAIREFVRNHDVTVFMFLLAVYQTLLYRYSGQKDFTVGTPVANRNRSEIEGLIGFFINSLIIRVNLNEDPVFSEFLQQVKQTTLTAFSNQDVSFEKLVEILQPSRNTSYSPLFQVMFVLHNTPVGKLETAGISLEVLDVERGTAKFDLILNIFEIDDNLKATIEFNTDLYNSNTIIRMAEHYRQLLRSILDNSENRISGLNLLSETEKNTILTEWSGRIIKESNHFLIPQLVEKQVQKNPDAVAVRCLDEQITFSQLDQKVDQIVNRLSKLGVTKGSAVGLCVERSPGMIAALLAVLKGGWILVPLDPDYPQERLNFIIEDAALSAIITETKVVSRFQNINEKVIIVNLETEYLPAESEKIPEIVINKNDPAYIIYTSGSTGQPKGVLISHASIANHCLQTAKIYEVTPEDRYLQFAAINFDAALEQVFTALISGAQLVLRENDIWLTSDFSKKIEKYGLSVINLPTPYWEQLMEEWHENPGFVPKNHIRLFIAGGDSLHTEFVEKWRNLQLKNTRLLNAYGPTETTVTASLFEVPKNKSKHYEHLLMPIGSPLPNRKFYILDNFGNLVPQGIPGELCIGGEFLAIGYLNRESLTKQQFIPNPFGEGKLYKTGDIVRWLEGGIVEFLGRKDNQVKIRGFRIELGEIEAAIRNHPVVKDVVVLAREDSNKSKVLAGYLLTKSKEIISRDEIRHFLSNKLPDYMIPSAIMILEKFPFTPSGKIDKKALPAPDKSDRDLKAVYIAPRTEVEERIAAIIGNVLGIDKVGVFDNFFELGGHSMQAIRIISSIREEFQVEIELKKMFEMPNVAGLSQEIAKLRAEQIDEAELEEMLAELENISDEEASKLLNG